jgi:hypothetical protein
MGTPAGQPRHEWFRSDDEACAQGYQETAKQYAEGERPAFADFGGKLTKELGRAVPRDIKRYALNKYAPQLKRPRGKPIDPNRSR